MESASPGVKNGDRSGGQTTENTGRQGRSESQHPSIGFEAQDASRGRLSSVKRTAAQDVEVVGSVLHRDTI